LANEDLLNLYSVFGAIDDEVIARPEQLPKVAGLLPAYRHGAAGWYQATGNWYQAFTQSSADAARATKGKGAPAEAAPVAVAKGARPRGKSSGKATGPEAPADPKRPALSVPELSSALQGLANSSEPMGYLTPRTLLAVAALVRAIGTPGGKVAPHYGDDIEGLLCGALQPIVRQAAPQIAGSEARTRSRALLELLDDHQAYPDLSSWPMLLKDAAGAQLIPGQLTVPPMQAAMWTVVPEPSVGGVAVAFETHHRFHGLTRATLEGILEPDGWTNYLPPWCTMTTTADATGMPFGPPEPAQKGDPGPWSMRRLEVVSLLCPGGNTPPPDVITFRTCLDFLNTPLPDGSGAVLEYRRSPDQSAGGGDGALTVDEGSLLVRSVGTAVDLITTKRVQFQSLQGMPPLEVAFLAQLAWVLGYSSLAEFFVNKVLGNVNSLTGGGVRVQTLSSDTGGQSANLGTMPATALRECTHIARSSMNKLAAGSYGINDYLADVRNLTGHGVARSMGIADIWLRPWFGTKKATNSGSRAKSAGAKDQRS
jgi:hypothetical protein